MLRVELPGDAYRRVLVRMHDLVIPAVANPLLLADFLSASCDQGARCRSFLHVFLLSTFMSFYFRFLVYCGQLILSLLSAASTSESTQCPHCWRI